MTLDLETVPSFPVPNGTGDFSHALMKYPREAAYRRKGLFPLTAPEGWRVPGGGAW